MSSEEVWAAFSGRLRAFIGKRVRAEADVEDILQDVFAKIHAGLPRLRQGEKLEAWLFQVARRAVVDHARRRRAAPLPEELAGPERPSEVEAEIASWLEPMMALLPEEERELLRLSELEGLPQKELAARLGLSLSGAKSRLRRARSRLRKAVLDCCHVELDRRGRAVDYDRKRTECGPCACD